jgi:hypothetical protein
MLFHSIEKITSKGEVYCFEYMDEGVESIILEAIL